MTENTLVSKMNALKLQLDEGQLGDVLNDAMAFAENKGLYELREKLQGVKDNYYRMLDFMLQGGKDEQRFALFDNMSKEVRNVIDDIIFELRIADNAIVSLCRKQGGNDIMQPAGAQSALEGFMQDAAMLSLEDETTRKEKMKLLSEKHLQYLNSLFCNIVSSRQWNEDICLGYVQLLTTPTIDNIDAQVLVSAVTMALLFSFDRQKYACMLKVYMQATDEKVKQRALAAWTMTIQNLSEADSDCVRDMLDDTMFGNNVADQLLALQEQVMYCIEAQKDWQKIHDDIIPELMKNPQFNVTRYGISNTEENELEDILHPEAEEEAMENMEKHFKKMTDMQKNGSDIYFGGFAQMKRFPFFNKLINWFLPFFSEHPDLQGSDCREIEGMLNVLDATGPFCASDKYSFAMVLAKTLKSMPAEVRKMMGSGAFMPNSDTSKFETPDMYRRLYLQDLYRFFKLCDMRSGFDNPFSTETIHTDAANSDVPCCIFLLNDVLPHRITDKVKTKLAKFLQKRNETELCRNVIMSYDEKSIDYIVLKGKMLVETCHYEEAIRSLEVVLLHDQNNKAALKLMARACFEDKRYDDAAEYYKQLTLLYPDNKNFMINFCMSLLNSGEQPKALNYAYSLDIKWHEDIRVRRLLAWTLVCTANFDKAEGVYGGLLNSKDVEATDYLNAGYCAWFAGNVKLAVERFKHFADIDGIQNLKRYFVVDEDILAKNGLGAIDTVMMVDMIGRG